MMKDQYNNLKAGDTVYQATDYNDTIRTLTVLNIKDRQYDLELLVKTPEDYNTYVFTGDTLKPVFLTLKEAYLYRRDIALKHEAQVKRQYLMAQDKVNEWNNKIGRLSGGVV